MLAGADGISPHRHELSPTPTPTDVEGSHRPRAELARSTVCAADSIDRATLATFSANAARRECHRQPGFGCASRRAGGGAQLRAVLDRYGFRALPRAQMEEPDCAMKLQMPCSPLIKMEEAVKAR